MTMPSPAPDPAHQPAPGPAFDPGSANERTVTTREFLQIFTAVMLPMLMAIIDQTLLATATPVIAADLGDLFNSSWIATAYLLASATMVPVYGRLGDRYGRRRMLLIAMGVFIAGSLGCAASQSMMQLIASRTVQGLGAGGLMSLSFALIGELVPPRQRVSYQAYFAINSMAGNILGPMIGGLVVAHVSWRWLPAVNIPLGVLATWRLMKLPRGLRHPESPGLSDLPGLGLFAAGTLLVLFALSSAGHRFAWISWQTVTILALGVASWWVLFLHEKRLAAPFFPIELLQMPAVRQWLRTAMLSTFCLLALIFYLPLYFQLGLHVDSATSGMLLTPVLLGFITGGALGGRRAGRTGDPKSIPIAGNALAAIAILALAFAPRHVALVAAVGFFAGLGLGPTMPLVQVVVQTVAGRHKLGAATSLTVLARTLGAALGTALVGAVIFSLLPDVDLVQLVRRTNPAAMPSDEVILRAFQAAFMVTAAVAAAASINAWRATRVKI